YNPAAANLDFLQAGQLLTISYTVKTNDGIADSAPQVLTFTINGTNDAPTVANAIADQVAAQGSAFSFAFAANTFSDVDVGDTLTYTATLDSDAPLPGWLSFNAGTRTFSGTPGPGDVGTIAVKVTATDGSAAAVSDTFNIAVGNVNDAPVIQNVGGTVTLTVSVAHGTLTPTQAILDAITGGTLTGLDGDGSDGSLSVRGSAAA